MSEPTYTNGRINFEFMIRTWAREQEMTFGDALRFLGSRDSLECAASLIGVELTDYHSETDIDKLNQFGKYLDNHGFIPPRMWERGLDKYVGQTRNVKPDSANKPKDMEVDIEMGEMKLTREEYLQKRVEGKTKATIAKEQGVTAAALVHWLGKWGLKDPVIEELEISRLKASAVNVDTATTEPPGRASGKDVDANTSSPQSYQQPVDNLSSLEDGGLYVTVRIRVTRSEWPGQLMVPPISVDRDTLIQMGLACLSNASAWAHKELLDIIGEGDLQTPLQSFITRKCTEFTLHELAQ